MLGSSPEVHRLAQEAAQEVGPNDFFEAELDNPLDALEHYCGSHLAFQRLAYAQGIAAAAAGAQYQDCVEVLLPLVERLARDGESEIRSAAVQQIQGLGKALHAKDCERSLRDIEASLLVCAQQCALDDDDEVSQAAVAAFQQLVLLLPAARATAASKRAVDRLEQRGTDDGMVVAVRLLAHTVPCWTPEALRRHVPRYISRWANHRDFSVREALSSCMSLVLKATPLQLCHQLLLPFFYQLCRDSNWRVRRACAADLPRLAASLQERGEGAAAAATAAEGVAVQPYGQCCAQPSSCLHTIGFSSELGNLSSGNLVAAAGAGAPGLHVRNRSSGSLGVPPRTTAEIMTKHPMHSSLIMDGALAATASPSSSAPPSPTSQHQHPLGAGGGGSGGGDQQQQQLQQQGQQPEQGQQQGQGQQQEQGEQQEQGQQAPSCALEAAAPLLHDCWCALRQCMELLTADSSHWVKVAAMSGLGPFMLALPRCQVGQLLLGRFTGMASSTVVIYEISVALACAQHFGGVAVRLGMERWPEMRDAWHALQASRDPAVLCELVRCLPGLVQVLGPAITVQELLPALAALLQSHLTWVSGQLVAVFSQLLELLPPSSQEMVLKVLEQLVSSSGERSKAWRLRRDLALQLGRMAAAVGPDAIVDSLWPAAMALCCDPVAAVRSAAAGQVGMTLAALPASMLCRREQPGSPIAADAQPASSQDGAVGTAASSDSTTSTSSTGNSAASSAGSDAGSACGADLDASVGSSGPADDSAKKHGDQVGAGGLPNGAAPTHGGLAASAKSSRRGVGRAVAAGAGKVATYGVRFQDAFGDGLASQGYGSGCAASGGSGSRSSLDLELDLPSALAPAPAGFAACGAQGEEEQEAATSGGPGSATALLLPAGCSSADASAGTVSTSSESEAEASSGSDASASDGEDVEEPGTRDTTAAVLRAPTPPPPLPPRQQLPKPVPVPSRSPAAAIHPAMMPVGHPAMAAVGSQHSSPQAAGRRLSGPTALKAKSAGDLLKVEAASAGNAHAHVPPRRRHSSNSIPGRTTPSPFALSSGGGGGGGGGVDRGFDVGLPEPGIAAPHQYVACLANYFGRSANHQQRQLYVPLVMGVLAACHDRLSCAQAAQLLDRLEVLAADSVPGVRYAVAAALQHLRQTAMQLQQQQQQQQQQSLPPQTPQQQQQQQQAQANGVHDSYHDYVMQLAERSRSGSLPAATEAPAPAEMAGSASKPPLGPDSSSSRPAASGGSVMQQQPQQQLCGADGGVLPPLSPAQQQQQQRRHQSHRQQRGHGQSGEQRHDVCCETCGVSVDASGDAPAGLEWLVKLSSCQQLERLIGVVALTTGPL